MTTPLDKFPGFETWRKALPVNRPDIARQQVEAGMLRDLPYECHDAKGWITSNDLLEGDRNDLAEWWRQLGPAMRRA
jgi:hypothetical protein